MVYLKLLGVVMLYDIDLSFCIQTVEFEDPMLLVWPALLFWSQIGRRVVIDETDESFYTSSIDEIEISFKNNKITCKIKNKEYSHDRIIRLWQGFK